MRIYADTKNSCGEGPLWHPDEQCLYWIDVDTGQMFRWTPEQGGSQEVYNGPAIGGMTLHEDGRLLLFKADGVIELWSAKGTEVVVDGIEAVRGTRFNDVIADPEGRVFAGTMPGENSPGQLYRLDPDGSLTCLLDSVGLPNGMAFNRDLSAFFFTDTQARTIYRFDYDRKTGDITNQQAFIKLEEDEAGNPDGLTVDNEDCLWSARFGGYGLVRYSPRGEQLMKLELPAENVTSLCFQHDSFQAYITSAGGDYRPQAGEWAGALFGKRLPARGRPEFRSRRTV